MRANTRRWPNSGIMLTHRLQSWANISPVLRYSVVFGVTLNVGQRHRRRANITELWFKASCQYRQHSGTACMKYWLGPNGYWACTSDAGPTFNRHWVVVSLYSPPAVCNARPAAQQKAWSLVWCWASVADGGPAMGQCLVFRVLTIHIVFRT